jgi:hypothetical protein
MPRLDLLLVSIPPSELEAPPLAPALLKAAVESNGFKCQTVDFSLECFEKIFDKNYLVFNEWCNTLPDHFDWKKITQEQLDLLDRATDLFITLLQKFNPKYVGISVFSNWQQRFAFFLCQKIKKSNLDINVILGGMGCDTKPTGLHSVANLTSFDHMQSYADFMKKSGLAEFVVLNDGEAELVSVLRGKPSIPAVPNEVPFNYEYYPDYDNYEFGQYFFINQEKKLLVQGSKGCVRQCVFCNEHDNYSKFYYKSGTDIAEEIIYLSKKYGIYKFQFTDSLVNGSLIEFKKFTTKLAEYNSNNTDKKITWHGNYICRSKNTLTDEDFSTMKLSGAHGLTIGAESGSNRVLQEMNKRTTVEDLEYEISKFEQFGIDCYLLFLIGFYNETWDDFMQTLKLLKRLHRYFYTGTIASIRCGSTLMIKDWKQINSEHFATDQDNAYNWVYLSNPNLTLTERVRRRIIIQEFCDQMSIPVSYSQLDLLIVDGIYNNDLDAIGQFDNAHN